MRLPEGTEREFAGRSPFGRLIADARAGSRLAGQHGSRPTLEYDVSRALRYARILNTFDGTPQI